MKLLIFFLSYYGLNFSNGNTVPGVLFIPFLNNPTLLYPIISMALPTKDNRLLSKTPCTNAYIVDDGYELFLTQDIMVGGTYAEMMSQMGGMMMNDNGMVNVVNGSLIMYGQYRFMTTCTESGKPVQFFETITYKGICPITQINFQGMPVADMNPTLGSWAFQCELDSPTLGTGVGSGYYTQMMVPGLPDDSTLVTISLVNVMRWPTSVMDMMTTSLSMEQKVEMMTEGMDIPMRAPLVTEKRDVVAPGELCGCSSGNC